MFCNCMKDVLFFRNKEEITINDFIEEFYLFLLFKDHNAMQNLRELCEILQMAILNKTNCEDEFKEKFINESDVVTIFTLSPNYDTSCKMDLSFTLESHDDCKIVTLSIIDQEVFDTSNHMVSTEYIAKKKYTTNFKDSTCCMEFVQNLQSLFNNILFVRLTKEYEIEKYKEMVECKK